MENDGDSGPSELGTKEYWDRTYELEINNFKSHGDVGEEWFGEDSALRVVRWLSASERVDENSSIIDIGCGNGMLLVYLAQEGYTNLQGVDYSEGAISLARAVADKMGLPLKLEAWDLLSSARCPGAPHDVALDKGTYDAVGLREDGCAARAEYAQRVLGLLRPGGLLIITSCNWTSSELEHHFTSRGFSLVERLPTPTFRFGGSVGSVVTSLVFQTQIK